MERIDPGGVRRMSVFIAFFTGLFIGGTVALFSYALVIAGDDRGIENNDRET